MKEADRKKAIEIQKLSKSFGDFKALKSVSLEVFENEFFTLLGPSGCGKTTLLRMIAGFEAPTSGRIVLNGEQVENLPPHKRSVNTVFQSYALFPHMSVAQNIAFALDNLGWDRTRKRERVQEMLTLVLMTEFAGSMPAQLSGGQQQRIALARALAPAPQVLLLDEPLSALDLKLRQAMRKELRQLQRKTGVTFVFVTHDQEEALDMSDRICVIGHGEIQQLGTPDEIYEGPKSKFVADFIGDTNFLDVEVLAVDGDKATVRTAMGDEITTYHAGVKTGESATLSIRPEKFDFGDQAQGVTMDGIVVDLSYLGGYTHYVIQVGDAEIAVSQRNNVSRGIHYERNQKIRIGFQPDAGQVLTK